MENRWKNRTKTKEKTKKWEIKNGYYVYISHK